MSRTSPTPDEKRRMDLLLPILDGAVQLKILELRDFSDHDRAVLAANAVDRIAANGDVHEQYCDTDDGEGDDDDE